MSKSQTLVEEIIAFLQDGEKTLAEIHEWVSGKNTSIDSTLSRMVKRGDIARLDTALYCLKTEHHDRPLTENPREEAENAETINKMLNLYDTVLDNVGLTIEKELGSTVTLAEKIDLIKSLRWLGAAVDQLMKRWYLVHRGYDSNTRQAQEDAKVKARKAEAAELEKAPYEERIIQVGHYHPDVEGIWNDLPEPKEEKRTV